MVFAIYMTTQQKIDIEKFWSLIMINKQLLDLTSPPSAEFDTAQELLQYCNNHAKQNCYAVATKKSIREKIFQSNVILKESTKKFENIQLHKTKTNII